MSPACSPTTSSCASTPGWRLRGTRSSPSSVATPLPFLSYPSYQSCYSKSYPVLPHSHSSATPRTRTITVSATPLPFLSHLSYQIYYSNCYPVLLYTHSSATSRTRATSVSATPLPFLSYPSYQSCYSKCYLTPIPQLPLVRELVQ
jgi:hypothetical protein